MKGNWKVFLQNIMRPFKRCIIKSECTFYASVYSAKKFTVMPESSHLYHNKT